MNEGRWNDSAQLWREAAKLYPEAPGLLNEADYVEGVAAFYAKNYDKALAANEALWRRNPKSSGAIAGVASALACKYAVTGDEEFRRKAEEFISQARAATENRPQAKQEFLSFEERMRHRLQTRLILSPEEYEARFGAARADKKE
jgi:hypothetical protein